MAQGPTWRQQQKDHTRRNILRSAYELFAESGYERATMRALASRAGVGLGTIFKHFPDKPSLLAAAYQEDLGAVIRDAFTTMPRHGLVDQLVHLTARIYAFYAENLHFSRTLFKEALFLGGEHGEVLDRQLEEFLKAVAGLVRASFQKGEFPPDMDPFLTARVYGSFYLGSLVLGLKGETFDVQSQVRLVEDMLRAYFRVSGESGSGG